MMRQFWGRVVCRIRLSLGLPDLPLLVVLGLWVWGKNPREKCLSHHIWSLICVIHVTSLARLSLTQWVMEPPPDFLIIRFLLIFPILYSLKPATKYWGHTGVGSEVEEGFKPASYRGECPHTPVRKSPLFSHNYLWFTHLFTSVWTQDMSLYTFDYKPGLHYLLCFPNFRLPLCPFNKPHPFVFGALLPLRGNMRWSRYSLIFLDPALESAISPRSPGDFY